VAPSARLSGSASPGPSGEEKPRRARRRGPARCGSQVDGVGRGGRQPQPGPAGGVATVRAQAGVSALPGLAGAAVSSSGLGPMSRWWQVGSARSQPLDCADESSLTAVSPTVPLACPAPRRALQGQPGRVAPLGTGQSRSGAWKSRRWPVPGAPRQDAARSCRSAVGTPHSDRGVSAATVACVRGCAARAVARRRGPRGWPLGGGVRQAQPEG